MPNIKKHVNVGSAFDKWTKERDDRFMTNEQFAQFLLDLLSFPETENSSTKAVVIKTYLKKKAPSTTEVCADVSDQSLLNRDENERPFKMPKRNITPSDAYGLATSSPTKDFNHGIWPTLPMIHTEQSPKNGDKVEATSRRNCITNKNKHKGSCLEFTKNLKVLKIQPEVPGTESSLSNNFGKMSQLKTYSRTEQKKNVRRRDDAATMNGDKVLSHNECVCDVYLSTILKEDQETQTSTCALTSVSTQTIKNKPVVL